MVSNFSEKQGLEEIANLINPLRQTVSYLQWLLFHACLLSHFSHIQLFETLWNVAHQALLSVGFSRQEYWSGLPCPAPGYIPDPGVEPASLMLPALQADSLPTEPWGKPMHAYTCIYMQTQSLQSSLTFYDSMDCSLPDCSLCPWNSPVKNTGVGCPALLQGSSQSRDQTQVSPIAGHILYHWAT